jgi:dTDP-4-dehydrorhamnose reductase
MAYYLIGVCCNKSGIFFSMILVIGGNGLLGQSLISRLSSEGNKVIGTTRRNSEVMGQSFFYLDLENFKDDTLFDKQFESIFICVSPSFTENSLLNRNIVKIVTHFSSIGTQCVILSSNSVFDGKESFVSIETELNPKTKYGREKAALEKELKSFIDRIAIVRFSKVINKNFEIFSGWSQKLKTNSPIFPFFDMVMSPISLDLVIDILVCIWKNKSTGIFQFSANSDLSYSECADFLFSKLPNSERLIHPISYKSEAIEFAPKNTTMDSYRVEKEFGISAPSPYESLEKCYEYLRKNKS